MNTGTEKALKTLILYWTATKNTEKVADTIKQRLEQEKITPDVVKITAEEIIDFYSYDLVFLGTPSYSFLPPDPALQFIQNNIKHYRDQGHIKLQAPKIPGKTAVVFCTYSGPHTGINEAIPVTKYIGQFFEHIGFDVAGEWCIVGEFHGHEDFSTKGRLGDIRGRPNEHDLAKVEKDVGEIIASLRTSS
jgi:flavodoxin